MTVRSLLVGGSLALALGSCAVNPATGKRELMLVSESQELAMGKEYDQQVVAEMGLYDDELHLTSSVRHERFRDVVFRDAGECNAVFGLIRMDVLRKTALIGNYPASDMILLSELALHGNFHELPEALFYRRDHPQTSIRANVTTD